MEVFAQPEPIMRHTVLATIALLLLPLAASAQPSGPRHSGFGGGIRPLGVGHAPVVSPSIPFTPLSGGLGGAFSGGSISPYRSSYYGSTPGYGYWPGFGGFYPYYGYGYGYGGYGYGWGGSSYLSPSVTIQTPLYVPVPVAPAEPNVELSSEAAATLVLEFPAPAEVWVNGKKGEGEPQETWTLTSPSILLGTDYPFEVKARWKANGKTYQYEKSVEVAAGKRSRSLVLSGTEIRE